MGCIQCKKQVSEQITPYTRKKQSRWRLIVGVEAKGYEFNAQIGLVHIGDEKYECEKQQIELQRNHPEPPIPPDDETLEYNTVR